MIRLLLDPIRFECESPDEAFALAGLFGIRAVPVQPVIVTTPAAPVVVGPAREAARRFKGDMVPTGHEKDCKKCGKTFPVVDRTDCAAVYCRDCRPKPPNRRKKGAQEKAAPKGAGKASAASLPKTAKAPIRGCAKAGCLELFEATHPGMVHCEAHRLGSGQAREQAGRPVLLRPVPAAGEPSAVATPEIAGFPMVTCRGNGCGATVPSFESIGGLCLQCAPMGARKAS